MLVNSPGCAPVQSNSILSSDDLHLHWENRRMLNLTSQSLRNFAKQALQRSRVKLVYQRVTLTRFTTLFFFLALINCIILIILQSIAFTDNEAASEIISGFLTQANITQTRVVFISGDELYECSDIPQRGNSGCAVLVSADADNANVSSTKPHNSRRQALDESEVSFLSVNLTKRHHKVHAKTEVDMNGQIDGLQLDNGQSLDQTCLQSLIWLNDVIHDSMAEDIVTLTFQVWLLLLSFVTILNESLPHLGAAIAGHVLVTAWAGYRLNNTYKLQAHYETLIVQQACNDVDFLGSWWNVRADHTIPILVFNAVALVLATYLASRLYKVYAQQSFNRVGASSRIHNIYRLALVLSVCVQLGGFFAIASTAMWLDKASSGTIKSVAQHLSLYRAVFSTMGVLELPWAILGWTYVRREDRRQFIVFAGISLLLLASSSGIFASPLYQFIFQTWPFFATMTITSYLLIVLTSILGVWCRTQFGKGLSEFLKEEETPEGADFAPVYYAPEKFKLDLNRAQSSFDSEEKDRELPVDSLPFALAAHRQPVQKPPRARFSFHSRYKTSSVYSDMNRGTVKLSSTPPLFRDTLSSVRDTLSTLSSFSSLSPISERSPPPSLPSASQKSDKFVRDSRGSASHSNIVADQNEHTERTGDHPEYHGSPISRSPSDRARGLPRNPRPVKD
ncbi:uncharacterized protein C8R40DRAFT_847429 [Lentinula edodes]|uniref:uncharacterized protein n=1 Tax=Lentinula edodes TaxID=5353 RepID=UPI001E8EC009|nr:uncharacterized protein C8R40DRAFT_847429 [Lentinula edodes]KAH7868342.1 hypothetical protein C8R40DRAFT_847429 [Lentinula edodes]